MAYAISVLCEQTLGEMEVAGIGDLYCSIEEHSDAPADFQSHLTTKAFLEGAGRE